MRKIAFGYSTRCNIRCSHCVAADETPIESKMELTKAKEIIDDMARAGVTGISFTAGEPFIYFDDLLKLLHRCRKHNIYTRVVTNSYWAKTPEKADEILAQLKQNGLCQLRMSLSRWHQQHVSIENILNGANACTKKGVEYFISFVTDFSEQDDPHEQFLRKHKLMFFPEPVIYAGRADLFERREILTDYQENRCGMNPYLAPDLTMYGCCDAGSHFNTTNFFRLGNLKDQTVEQLFTKSENSPFYNCIRNMGITSIASYAGFTSREIVTYRKCELCKKIFDSAGTVKALEETVAELQHWHR